MLMFAEAPAANVALYEQEVKAGMVYNFLKYTTWPVDQEPRKTICIFGNGTLNTYLKKLDGKTVNQKVISVLGVGSARDMDMEICNVLFINASEGASWPQLAESFRNKNILTVSDIGGFARSGGMIEFNKKDNRIQVELNIDTVNAAQLRIEDRLLKLVKVVHSTPQGEGR